MNEEMRNEMRNEAKGYSSLSLKICQVRKKIREFEAKLQRLERLWVTFEKIDSVKRVIKGLEKRICELEKLRKKCRKGHCAQSKMFYQRRKKQDEIQNP